MIGYIVLNLHEGDMVSIVGMYRSRQDANTRVLELMEQHDTSTSWWKIVEYESNLLQYGQHDIVIRVSWGSSNRVKVVGLFQHGAIPQGMYEGKRYFVETVEF